MRAQTIAPKDSAGRVLHSAIVRPNGQKFFARDPLVSPEEARILEREGYHEISVAELEPGEVGEDEAVTKAAVEMG